MGGARYIRSSSIAPSRLRASCPPLRAPHRHGSCRAFRIGPGRSQCAASSGWQRRRRCQRAQPAWSGRRGQREHRRLRDSWKHFLISFRSRQQHQPGSEDPNRPRQYCFDRIAAHRSFVCPSQTERDYQFDRQSLAESRPRPTSRTATQRRSSNRRDPFRAGRGCGSSSVQSFAASFG